ncbi:MAG: metallophosphoesterase [Thermoleophilia bacterium]|nr:metallophosphoesterase [Thermoleophilia bacterium]
MRAESTRGTTTAALAEDQRRRRGATVQLPAVLGGGGENGDRHAEGGDREHPPRPLGVASGTSWEPYEPTRSFAMNELTHEFLEKLEAAPWLQDIAAAAMGLIAPLVGGGTQAPPPPDVVDEPGSWHFAAIGDYGAGTTHLQNVVKNIEASHPRLVITAGDNVYPSGRWQDYQKNWEPSMGKLARSVPFMPSLGNHDMYRDDLRPYFAHFPHLQGLAYYTFTEQDAQFFALDSDQDLRAGSAQRKWLEESLKHSKSRWKVVYLHYPMYGTSLKQFDDIRTSVQPLLEKYGVQLVVAGHEHNYMRAKPQGGVYHLLTGGGGQRVYPFMGKMAAHLAFRAAVYNHLEFSVGKHTLVVRAIDDQGRRVDTVEIPVDSVAQAQRGASLLAPNPA